MPTRILGLSAYYHDSAAALLVDGELVAAAQEERFSRRKHDAGFPAEAIRYCLAEGDISLRELDHVVFYDKPLLKFERLLETYLSRAPHGLRAFLTAMPVWLKEKLYLKDLLRRELSTIAGLPRSALPPLLFTSHHESHASSAFFPSPFDHAAVLCLDGVGEWATTSAWIGHRHTLSPLWEIHFPHSLGLLYSAFTYYCGFKVNSGEYKLMGLAPYGEPRYVDRIREHLIDVKPDGSFRMNLEYFDYLTGLRMTNGRFARLFGGPPRPPDGPLEPRHMDLARSIQALTEEIVLRLAATLHRETGEPNLCLAGGVALNCVANARVLREGPFERLWIQPAAGDAGGAPGAAWAVWHRYLENRREPCCGADRMGGAYLGPAFGNAEIQRFLDERQAPYRRLDDQARLLEVTARLLAGGAVVGWHQGRMEFGPRALGNRSILGDPRSPQMQSTMNLKIKYRESFRPFAPAVLAERAREHFELATDSPYMLLVAEVNERQRLATEGDAHLRGIDKLKLQRSHLPAITHVDYSARVQTVHAETNPRFHGLLEAFERLTGCPVLINTSFNVRGEPIVCTPADSYRCFMGTEMDHLVLGDFLLDKRDQPAREREAARQARFEAD